VTTEQIILLVTPVLVLQIILLALGIWDLLKPERRVRGGSKPLWALVMVLINIIGPIVYFLAGREDA
jgi:hypothetical protein